MDAITHYLKIKITVRVKCLILFENHRNEYLVVLRVLFKDLEVLRAHLVELLAHSYLCLEKGVDCHFEVIFSNLTFKAALASPRSITWGYISQSRILSLYIYLSLNVLAAAKLLSPMVTSICIPTTA